MSNRFNSKDRRSRHKTQLYVRKHILRRFDPKSINISPRTVKKIGELLLHPAPSTCDHIFFVIRLQHKWNNKAKTKTISVIRFHNVMGILVPFDLNWKADKEELIYLFCVETPMSHKKWSLQRVLKLEQLDLSATQEKYLPISAKPMLFEDMVQAEKGHWELGNHLSEKLKDVFMAAVMADPDFLFGTHNIVCSDPEPSPPSPAPIQLSVTSRKVFAQKICSQLDFAPAYFMTGAGYEIMKMVEFDGNHFSIHFRLDETKFVFSSIYVDAQSIRKKFYSHGFQIPGYLSQNKPILGIIDFDRRNWHLFQRMRNKLVSLSLIKQQEQEDRNKIAWAVTAAERTAPISETTITTMWKPHDNPALTKNHAVFCLACITKECKQMSMLFSHVLVSSMQSLVMKILFALYLSGKTKTGRVVVKQPHYSNNNNSTVYWLFNTCILTALTKEPFIGVFEMKIKVSKDKDGNIQTPMFLQHALKQSPKFNIFPASIFIGDKYGYHIPPTSVPTQAILSLCWRTSCHMIYPLIPSKIQFTPNWTGTVFSEFRGQGKHLTISSTLLKKYFQEQISENKDLILPFMPFIYNSNNNECMCEHVFWLFPVYLGHLGTYIGVLFIPGATSITITGVVLDTMAASLGFGLAPSGGCSYRIPDDYPIWTVTSMVINTPRYPLLTELKTLVNIEWKISRGLTLLEENANLPTKEWCDLLWNK